MKYAMLLCALLYSLNIHAGVSAVQESANLEKSIEDGKLAERTEKALDRLIRTAASVLQKEGYLLEAAVMVQEWDNEQKYNFRRFASAPMNSRDIGDHAPLSTWIDEKYQMLEMLIGIEACRRMKFDHLKTFNSCIPIVFRPCSYPLDGIVIPRIDEYRNHFAYGAVYTGLVPAVSYWVTYGVCVVATSGSGFVLVCGTLGNVAEKVVKNFVAPKLSDKVFNRACGG